MREGCTFLEFPPEATETLSAASDLLIENNKTTTAENLLHNYTQNIDTELMTGFDAFRLEAAEVNVHPYTADMILLLWLMPIWKEYAKKRSISMQVFHDSAMDLHWKLLECQTIYGIDGTFVADWMPGWFHLTRFALGRLQYELKTIPDIWVRAGYPIEKLGPLAINVHVPSSGKLSRHLLEASYAQAAGFFADHFGDSIPFVCHSWLLYPPTCALCHPDSGIRLFSNDYTVFMSEERPNGDDLWRVFGRMYDGNPKTLPEKTSLQKAFRHFLIQGGTVGDSSGFRLSDRSGAKITF